MNYDLICYGNYKENSVRCSHCIDKDRCDVETELREREKNEKSENIEN